MSGVTNELVKITENATATLEFDKRIYFSDAVVDSKWKTDFKTVQQGLDLGERMRNAFKDGFDAGYKKIVLIGSDLPDINATHITKGIEALKSCEVVFGPAEDGGYYLVGLSKMNEAIFKDKPWSQSHLLHETLQELQKLNVSFRTLDSLNDIDTYEDLIVSDFYKSNLKLQEKIQQLND
jgi:rSAM/selenodomain-associated transferase 1